MTPTRDDSIPADPGDEGCHLALDASATPLRVWTEVLVASIEAVADTRTLRFRMRLESPGGDVTLTLTTGARMAPPLSVGERARARAFMFPTTTGRAAMVAITVDGETRLFEGPHDDARELPDFTFTRGAERPDPATGGTRVTFHLAREGRQAVLGRGEGWRVLETPTGRWLCSGGHSEGRYGHSVFSLCKIVDRGVPQTQRPRPDDDRSVPIARIDGVISARLLAPIPRGAARGLGRRVSAIEVPDANAPTTWRVTLAAPGWSSLLGLDAPLPLEVTLPRNFALPLAVGDAVTLRALEAMAGNHPRRCVELRAAGRTVLVDGDDDFLPGLVGVTVTRGPCADPGKSRDGMARRQQGMVRVALDGVAGYSDDARRPRAIDTPAGRVLFAGSWTAFGAGPLLPGTAPRTCLTLARLRKPRAGDLP